MRKGEFFKICFLGTVLGVLLGFLIALSVALFPRAVGTVVQFWNERSIHVRAQDLSALVEDGTCRLLILGDSHRRGSRDGLRAVLACEDKYEDKNTQKGV
ncbi:hypothetical protein [Thermosulfurimonas sp. F29]|uniref:hypothetical protein n=1 Tax=Thermosulfurimonas sp. F29 TaxID=2867247 RepID=UPI001C83989E|nr:hypothetical protein [Thermosulfurimonas sp. F29]MBX6423799.1 hypothetical protein [Thermosulfurimonas sp. F29]